MKVLRWLTFWLFSITVWLLLLRSCVRHSPHGPLFAWVAWVIIPGTAALAVWVRQFDNKKS